MKNFYNSTKIGTRIITSGVLAISAFIPSFAFAQQISTFEQLVQKIYNMISSLVPLIVSLAVIVFLWGIFQLVRSSNEDARKDAIKIITFGIIALFVMVSVWGLVAILSNTFFGSSQVFIPQLR